MQKSRLWRRFFVDVVVKSNVAEAERRRENKFINEILSFVQFASEKSFVFNQMD